MTTTLENLPAQRARPDSQRRRLLPDERARLGKAARGRAPLDSHAAFGRAPGAPDPVALLEGQGASRIPELVPVRYGRMLASPFTFYRMVDGEPRIVAAPPLIVPVTDLMDTDAAGIESQLRALIVKYRRMLDANRRYLLEQYEFADMARKVVGAGSVGTRCWIILMLGRDLSDPLFLQVKEAEESVLGRFADRRFSPRYSNQGQRVVVGQRLMQASSDIFLGWVRIDAGLDGQPHDFYVRQLRDWKFSFDIAVMVPNGMRLYGEICGWSLARAHARSGDPIAIAAYLGGSDAFDRAITEFAREYADQNERDYAALREVAASGRITVASDL